MVARLAVAGLEVSGIVVVSGQGTPQPAEAQGNANGSGLRKWVQSRTPDGQPDLQGFWSNSTYVPLERPSGVTKEFYTPDEAAARRKTAIAREEAQTTPGTVEDIHYDFTQFGLDRSQAAQAPNLRTSLIVDPPDGKVPPMNEEGRRRVAAREAAQKGVGRWDSAESNQLDDRCLIMAGSGPPMMDTSYNSNYHIVQAPGVVMILTEMIHDVRIIPLDGRSQPPAAVKQWMGTSRGRWENNTLVVETTNFNGKGWIATNAASARIRGVPHSDALRLVERFTRVDADTISYEVTIEDPNIYTRPWTVAIPLTRDESYQMFEYACHEGNRAIGNILSMARAAEKVAAEGTKKK